MAEFVFVHYDISAGTCELPEVVEESRAPIERKTPRPMNSWLLFRAQKVRDFKAADPNFRAPQGEVSKMISELWKNATPQIRRQYEELANLRRVEHGVRYPDYKLKSRSRGLSLKFKTSTFETPSFDFSFPPLSSTSTPPSTSSPSSSSFYASSSSYSHLTPSDSAPYSPPPNQPSFTAIPDSYFPSYDSYFPSSDCLSASQEISANSWDQISSSNQSYTPSAYDHRNSWSSFVGSGSSQDYYSMYLSGEGTPEFMWSLSLEGKAVKEEQQSYFPVQEESNYPPAREEQSYISPAQEGEEIFLRDALIRHAERQGWLSS